MKRRADATAKPTSTKITLRLPLMMLEELQRLAGERDVPYRLLLTRFLAERVATEHQLIGRRRSRATKRE